MIGFEQLYYLLAIIPVFIAGWVMVKRGAKHSLIMSRVSVISLLIIALAGPYNPVVVTEIDDTPSITVLSDETESMGLFEEGTAQEIFERLEGQTPVTMERMKGLRSDIGDEILSSSERSYHVVVVSDGNNNFGSDVGEAVDFVSSTGSSVYAITQTPMVNELSVEITGGRTAVVGNENLVGIEVRQALSDARYRLTVEVDGETVYTTDETQTAVKKTINFQYPFPSLGPHVITARISSSDDMRTDNNIFNKTVYVVPKPEILLITSDTDSPMYNILNNQYALYTTSAIDVNNLSKYKAVVLDNSNNDHISSGVVDKLREYTANGRGLVVVGGDNSYDFVDYRFSELETILPVESYPSTYAGSVNIVIVMDISESMEAEGVFGGEKTTVVDLLKNKLGRDTNVGIAAFGSKAVQVSDGLLPMSGREALIEKVMKLKTSKGSTSIDEGIAKAAEMFTEKADENYIFIFSDGKIEYNYDECMDIIKGIDTQKINMKFYMINISIKDEFLRTDRGRGKFYMESLADMAGGNFTRISSGCEIDIIIGKVPVKIPPEGIKTFSLIRLDEEHFITRYLNISGTISGYNDVTQKVGANRLVTTSMGKPIVTSWQFGLGRVVSLSTDNGNLWAGGEEGLYSGENARVMPSIINWVVGDPQPDKGLVVYSSDMYLGSPGTITVLSDTLPSMRFDGQEVSMAKTEDRSFEGVLKPSSQGVFPLVVSAGGEEIEDSIAVNYPLEYRDVGNNPEFLEAVKRNRGGVYYPEQATSLLFSDIMTNSVRTTV
ncbi:MAG: VWA domain-containing protein, partial [Methanosarcinales archaeon]|nr:VWA domain-containing protein [Methanosarcinales archaeon]